MRFQFYPQLESVDCGPACLRMIAAHYGKKYSLDELKHFCQVTRLGITLYDIINGAKRMGFLTSPVKATVEQMTQVPLPAIIFWRQEHYVVLHRIEKGRNEELIFHIADPAYGKIKVKEELFEKYWLNNEPKGVALLLNPSDEFNFCQPDKTYADEKFKSIVCFVKNALLNHKGKFSVAMALFCVAMVTNWTIPLLFQRMIDQGVVPGSMSVVGLVLVAQLFIFLGNMVSDYFSSKILLNVNFRLGLDFLSQFLMKLIRLPISFFDTRLNTDLIQRIDDQDRLQSFLTYRIPGFIFSIFNLLAFSVIIGYYNMESFLLFLVFSAASIVWMSLFLEKRKVLDYSRFSISSENKSNIYELISGMPEIKINNAQHTKVLKWQSTQEKLNTIVLKALHLNYYQLFGVNFFSKVKDISITGLCAYLVINGEMTLGMMMSISYILGQLTRPIDQIVDFVRNAQEAKLSFDRMDEIQRKADENFEQTVSIAKGVETGFFISNMSFKYDGTYNPYVLNNISLSIPKGKITAIVGTSGSGKTTLLKLLLGFYYPQMGDIFLDDKKFNQVNVDEWRNKCGVVMQDGYIFSGTIAENIAIAEEGYDPERLAFAMATACIDDFILSLPLGVNTKIGSSGVELSGGQRQRILIARAVYKNPEFIFFDEATSSLDANNESRIMQNLNSFFHGKTVVVIAHRLSTVKNADQIIVIDKGCIIETGHHHDLIMNKSSYFELIKNQLELGN